MVGVYANRVTVGLIQSVAGNHVLVPPPELQIVATRWLIDANQSLVTGLDLLVTTNSSVLQLKQYQVLVQVSCLNENAPTAIESICSIGRTVVVLPTQNSGLRHLNITLVQPINPETVEIHDLSFIVTDLSQIPQSTPHVFIGVPSPMIQLHQGETTSLDVLVIGVQGERVGGLVAVSTGILPEGITAVLINQTDEFGPPDPGDPFAHAMTMLNIDVAPNAPMGTAFIQLVAHAFDPQPDPPGDQSFIQIEVLGPRG